MRPRTRAHAFAPGLTLVEVIVAIVVTTIVVGGTTVAIGQSLSSAQVSELRERVRARADLAASRIAADIASTVRDGDLYWARVLLEDGTAADRPADKLLILTAIDDAARSSGRGGLDGDPEGPVYEVQYRLGSSEGGIGGDDQPAPTDTGILWRRLDPAFDEYVDAGGVASPAAEGIWSLSIEAFDGDAWVSTWDSDQLGYPHAIRVIVEARGTDPVRRSVESAVARRVVALDRVPIPWVTLAPADRVQDANEAAGGDNR